MSPRPPPFLSLLALGAAFAVLGGCRNAPQVIPTYEDRMVRGRTFFLAGKWFEASTEFQAALDLAPLGAEASYFMGECFYEMGRYNEVIPFYTAALNLNNFPKAWGRLAFAYFLQEKWGLAAEHYKRALKEQPGKSREMRFNLGCCLYEMGRNEDAWEEFQLCREFEPGHPDAYQKLWAIATRWNDARKADVYYKEFRRLKPESADLRLMEEWQRSHNADIKPETVNRSVEFINTGRLRYQDKQYQAAADLFEKAALEDPRNAEARLYLARARVELREYDAAIEAYNKAMSLRPPDAPTYLELGWAHRHKGDLAGARLVWKAGLKLDPLNENLKKAVDELEKK